MTLIRLIVALTLTMIVPAGGYFLSGQIMGEVDAGLIADGFPPFQTLCAMPEAGSDDDLFAFCTEMKGLSLLMTVSIVAGIFGIAIPLVFLLASILSGTDRRRLAIIFPITVQATLVFVTVSAAMQGAVLTYGLFVAESYYLGRIHIYLIAVVGFGAAGVAYKLLMESLSFGARHENFIHAVSIGEDKAPGLHFFVTGLAEKLGARPPDNIIVGLDPTFFVTSANIRIPDSPRPLEGETLYVSLPLTRLMSVSELAAVVGHELGHFRGEDTAYSLKFAPVYAGLGNALMATSRHSGEGLTSLAKLPAKAMLSFMMDIFAMNERGIGRERELMADEAGAEAASATALVTSLMKVSLYAQIWDYLQAENIHRLNEGKTTRNLSSLLESRARFDIEHKKIDEIIDAVAETRTAHPTDTHPTVSERMKSLGVQRAEINKSQILVPETSAVLLFRNALALEEKLTVMEHKLMADAGFVQAGHKGRDDSTRHLAPIYRVVAAIIMADGVIDINEISRAEIAGAEAFPGFDSTDFRQACDYVDDSPDPVGLAGDLNDRLDPDQKIKLVAYLKSVAESDGEIDWAEQEFIEAVAEELGVSAA
jgi:Zn-dependent protease with chaperone function/uncharacterized tellurite resistance protein B-like protein